MVARPATSVLDYSKHRVDGETWPPCSPWPEGPAWRATRRHVRRRAHQHHRGPGRAPRGPADARAHISRSTAGTWWPTCTGCSNAMGEVADRIRSGEWTGHTGERITAVVNIGIGGSDLGPAMAHEALRDYADPDIECRFVSNIDPVDLYEKTHDLDPAETLFVVSSKTFTTLETLTNAAAARQWLLDGLGSGRRGGGQALRGRLHQRGGRDRVRHRPGQHVRLLGLGGGRYSYDSAIGFSLMVAIGPEAFDDMLAGFHTIDRHFADGAARGQHAGHPGDARCLVRQFVRRRDSCRAPLQPAPGTVSRLSPAADHGVERQVGAPRRLTGVGSTGEIFWGEPGTNGQHAFYQLIHQGTKLIPADFIGFASPPTRTGIIRTC